MFVFHLGVILLLLSFNHSAKWEELVHAIRVHISGQCYLLLVYVNTGFLTTVF